LPRVGEGLCGSVGRGRGQCRAGLPAIPALEQASEGGDHGALLRGNRHRLVPVLVHPPLPHVGGTATSARGDTTTQGGTTRRGPTSTH